MRVLVTGASGFAGRHALTELQAHGHETIGADIAPQAEIHLDVRDPEAFAETLAQHAPDAVLHLAGLAFVPDAEADPDLAFSLNRDSVRNLLDAIRRRRPGTRALIVTTGEVYGPQPDPAAPIDEDTPLRPASVYARSKAAADELTLAAAREHGLHALTARPQNHLGPGQSPRFVSSSFAGRIAAQAAAAARGETSEPMPRGNLDSIKDFTDVRDVVRAYRLLLEKGQPGLAYNIASEQPVRVGDLLDTLYDIAGIAPNHARHDPFWRETETVPPIRTDRIREHTGWRPEIPLRRTLEDLYRDLAGP